MVFLMKGKKPMTYDEILENRIQSAIGGWKGVSAKKMFGGVCHLIHGNMFCGVYKDFLILRLGEAAAAEALSKAHTKAFDITRRPMKGWVMVQPNGIETDEALTVWLQKAREFTQTLPTKE
jgi:TfoX/Sxy family transcriptional regulator of competence genes